MSGKVALKSNNLMRQHKESAPQFTSFSHLEREGQKVGENLPSGRSLWILNIPGYSNVSKRIMAQSTSRADRRGLHDSLRIGKDGNEGVETCCVQRFEPSDRISDIPLILTP